MAMGAMRRSWSAPTSSASGRVSVAVERRPDDRPLYAVLPPETLISAMSAKVETPPDATTGRSVRKQTCCSKFEIGALEHVPSLLTSVTT